MIGTLKQVLSIPNLAQLLSAYREPAEVDVLYSHYREIQQTSLQDIINQVSSDTQTLKASQDSSPDGTAAALRIMALELSIEARTRILIAEKILALLAVPPASEIPEKKKEKTRIRKLQKAKKNCELRNITIIEGGTV